MQAPLTIKFSARAFHCLIESEGIERSRYRGVNGEVA
jgi:hypothetical protein